MRNKNNVKKRSKKKTSKKMRCPKAELPCVANLVTAMSYEGTVVTNFIAQAKRAIVWKKLVDNKKSKQGDFKNSTAIMLNAFGGDSSSPGCSKNSKFTQRTTDDAVTNFRSLQNCASSIEAECNVPFNDTLALGFCNTIMHDIKSKNANCNKASTTDSKCNCWAEAAKKVAEAKNGTCRDLALNANRYMKSKKKMCTRAFSNCKKAEDDSIGILTKCLDGVEESHTPFIEAGNEHVQKSNYNQRTGVLTLEVPAHTTYDNVTIQFIPKAEQHVIISNRSCLLSNLSHTVNVTELNEALKIINRQMLNKTKYFGVNIIGSILSSSERENSNVELRHSCKDSVIYKTEHKNVSEADFEVLSKNDEDAVVFFDREPPVGAEGRSDKCWTERGCTGHGPNACGWNKQCWRNPADPEKHCLSLHTLSSGILCLECCVKKADELVDESCCNNILNDICICDKITTHNTFMDCYLRKPISPQEYEDQSRNWATQSVKYIKQTPRAVQFDVPVYPGSVYEEFTLFMHHAVTDGSWGIKNNMLMKIGQTCYIMDLPQPPDIYPIYPVVVARNAQLMGNIKIPISEQVVLYSRLTVIGLMDPTQVIQEVKDICNANNMWKVKRTIRVPLANEKVHANFWWPKPDGEMISNEIVHLDPCLPGWTPLATNCYQFVKAATHQEATTNCKNKDGYLAEIIDNAEQNAVSNFARESQPSINTWRVWLGAKKTEGDWIWSHSQANMIFKAWADNYPTNEPHRDCLITTKNFKWRDVNCNEKYSDAYALCEKNSIGD